MAFSEYSVVGRLIGDQLAIVLVVVTDSLEQEADLEVLDIETYIEGKIVLRKRSIADRCEILLVDDTVIVQILVLDVTQTRSAERVLRTCLDLILEIIQTAAVAVVRKVAPRLSGRIALSAVALGVGLVVSGLSDEDDLVLAIVKMTGHEQGEVRVETLLVAYGEFPSLVLVLTHVGDRIGSKRNTLVERNLGG